MNQNDSTNQNGGTQNPLVQQTPGQPAGGGFSGGMPPSVTPHGKETAPVGTQVGEVSDFVEASAHETAPVLEDAVESAGVEVSSDHETLQLNNDHRAVGITPAKESTPVDLQHEPAFASPMTLVQAEQAASGKANNSSTWLGKLVVFVFGQQQYKNHEE